MPTVVSESKAIRRELWTADDFLAWLEPGVHADLIDGEKSLHSPANLRHADLLKPDSHIPFAPALVVEVLSPRTADRDVGPKFAAYEEHGVSEYWVLDPQTPDHRFYRREGEFLTAFGEEEEVIRSVQVPGFHLRRTWLDPERLPDVAACLGGC